MLPHYILTELIGHFTLFGDKKEQLRYAESLASNTYEDFEAAIDHIKEYANGSKWSKELKEVMANDYFKPYIGLPKLKKPLSSGNKLRPK